MLQRPKIIAGYEHLAGTNGVEFPPVPGTGPVLGARWFKGNLLAIRSDGEVPILYVAGESDWEKVMACDAV